MEVYEDHNEISLVVLEIEVGIFIKRTALFISDKINLTSQTIFLIFTPHCVMKLYEMI